MPKGIKGFQKGNIPWSRGKIIGSNQKHSKYMTEYWSNKKTDPEVVKERKKLYAKKYRTDNREKLRSDTLWRKYRLTIFQFDKLIEEQNGLCLICGTLLDRQGHKDIKPHVDHDHNKDVVRGILCSKCNLLLGNAKDSVEILKSAIIYLTNKK